MRRPPKPPNAFTLIELLVVVAIIILMAAAAGPAFNAILAERGVDRGATDVADFLEMARNEAMTRQTYVWVGITGTATGGTQQLQMAAAYSVDASGTNNGLTINGTPNVMPFTKVLQVQNVAFSPWGNLKPATQNLWTSGSNGLQDVYPNGSNPSGASVGFRAGGVQFTGTNSGTNGTNAIITFSPQGEALLSGIANAQTPYGSLTAPYGSFYDIGLRQAHGAATPAPGATNVNDAAVIIDAATGATSIVELH